MRRIFLGAAVAALGSMMFASVALANVGDIDALNIQSTGEIVTGEPPAPQFPFSDRQGVLVDGTIFCSDGRNTDGQPGDEDTLAIDYGLWIKVKQNPNGENIDTAEGSKTGSGTSSGNAAAEGVGAFGPDFDPPAGISDDQPCTNEGTSYDAVVFRNLGSGFFQEDDAAIFVGAGTSAENGSRGPGPFVGDMEFAVDNDYDLEDDEGDDTP